ncbi:MAG: TIGR01777 family protein [Candidatus Marinimicrobia bacterium]|nr:TIGR01777 family protein [Candidatus Neomarinimicrobiota bacterium]
MYKVLISGASGLLGSACSEYFSNKGHAVFKLVRREPNSDNEIFWNPMKGELDLMKIEGFGSIINFSGKNIGLGRWTEKSKKVIYDSRIQSTTLLSESISKLNNPPESFMSSSAVGYYGETGRALVNEGVEPGKGFLSDLCVKWEKATMPAVKAGVKVIQLRSGVVFSAKGGALAKMLTPFRIGIGGRLGDGSQYLSWIMIEDYVRAVYHLMTFENIQSPVNIVSPEPVTNREFTKILAKVLNRPAIIPIPAFVLKTLLGQVAEEILLSSTRAIPQLLMGSGFEFKYPELEDALKRCLPGS